MQLFLVVAVVGISTASLVSDRPSLTIAIHAAVFVFATLGLLMERIRPRGWHGGAVLPIFAFLISTVALWALGSPSSVALVAYVTTQLIAAAVWGPKPAMVLTALMLLVSAGVIAYPSLLSQNPPSATHSGFWVGFALLSLVHVTLFQMAGRTLKDLMDGLRDSEERLKGIISNLPDGLVLLQLDGTITSVNIAGQRLIGESLPGRRLDQIPGLTPESEERARRLVDQSISGVGHDERLVLQRDGEERVVQVRLGAVPFGGTRAGMVLAIRDITAQVAAQKEQEGLRQRVVRQQKLESVGRLAGGIAHDFNNLLTIIRANAEFLERDPTNPLSRDQRESLADLKQAAERSASFTQRLLTLSRSHEFGRNELVADGVAKDVVQVFSRTLLPNVSLELEFDAPSACIEANTAELEAALLNLLLNAKDALGETGLIRVSSTTRELGPEDPIYLPVPQRDTYWTLIVADDGPGMDEATLDQATEPFFSTKSEGRGTGLGLSTVYQLMKHLDGGMHLESAVGFGTTVTLLIPQRGTVATVETLHRRESMEVELRQRILLVEDDPAVRAATVRALELGGYSVNAVDNGRSALQWFERNEPPELLLSDILLPGMSGTELAEQVSNQYPDTLVLHISGFTGSEADRPKHPVLSKPFAPSELKAFIEQHLEDRSHRDAQAP